MEIKRGRFKGKNVVFATSSRIDAIRELADEFMFEVFDFDAGEYLISDESSLLDFTEIGSGDTSKLWQNICSRYGVDAGDVSSDKIVDILYVIHSRRNQH